MKYDSFRIFNVYIEFLSEYEESIAASMSEAERKMFVRVASPVNSYQDCVHKLIDFLKADGFTVDLTKSTPVTGSLSQYIFCHRTSEETDKTIACEFNLRVSDHKLNSSQTKRRKNRFQKLYKPDIEKRTGKIIEDQKFPNIRYNNQLYSSFDDFLDAATRDIQNWSKIYGK